MPAPTLPSNEESKISILLAELSVVRTRPAVSGQQTGGMQRCVHAGARTEVNADAVATKSTELKVVTPAVANGGTDREGARKCDALEA